MTLLDSFEPSPDEMAVLSVVLHDTGNGFELIRGSLLVVPPMVATMSWYAWQLHELTRPLVQPDPPTAEYSVRADRLLAGRAILSVSGAGLVLDALINNGVCDALGPLPSFRGELGVPVAPLRVSCHMDTPSSTFITSAVRPATGYVLPGRHGWSGEPPSLWPSDSESPWINLPFTMGIPLSLTKPCPSGLFVGRLERTAWISSLRGGECLETFDCSVGLDPDRVDISDLVFAIEEWVNGDLVHAQEVRLEDWDTSAVRGEKAVVVRLPTLGAGVQRTVRLYHRAGGFLDGSSDRFGLVEQIAISIGVMGSSATPHVTRIGGPAPAPDFGQRTADVQRVQRQHHELRAAGADVTLLPPGADVRAELKSRLEQSTGPIRIVDRYFGKDPADWTMLPAQGTAEVLVSLGAPPPAPMSGVAVRRLPGKPPPFHGRAYLWDGGGLAVDASPDGFGNNPVLVTRLSPEVAARWMSFFAAWWSEAIPL
jgi:hypothetical protein